MSSSLLLTVARRRPMSSFQKASSMLITYEYKLLKSPSSGRYASAARLQSKSPPFDYTTDVLVVGSGAAALTAALRSRTRGLETLVVEKSDKLGGTTAYSGGGVWVPCNHLQPQHGIKDSPEDAATYLNAIVKEGSPVSNPERRAAYIQHSPRMAKFLEDQGFKWVLDNPYPDYHSLEPGACTTSRSLGAGLFDLNNLTREWRQKLGTPPDWQPVMSTVEARSLFRLGSSMRDFIKGTQVAVFRTLWNMVRGKRSVRMGVSLVAQLLHLNLRSGTRVWVGSGLAEILTNSAGEVIGAVVQQGGSKTTVRAERGVILAAGGFSRNPAMREEFLRQPSNDRWSATVPEDNGDAIRAGINVGADVALMEHAWWMPCFLDNGRPAIDVYARSMPHSIIVDQSGRRYFNESECYCDAGDHMLSRNSQTPAIHSWLIIDSRHRKKYMLGRLLPGITPKSAIESGFLHKAVSLGDLAANIGVDGYQLEETVRRFNGFAEKGIDEDFHRGLNPYNKVFSDPSHKPNSNLGTIERPPYYAVKVYPGDIGTKGGLLTDKYARVMKKDGTYIKGLYAAGNTTASVFGSRYPGSGGTLGPGMTFGYVAAEKM
ncbi:hypothetical protein ACJ41O_000241 [Fusarium nematophilum]